MIKEFNTYASSDGEHQIHYFCIAPESPKAIIQIAHGVAEHIERYVVFAIKLAQQGYAVFANDHLGHGKTAANEDELVWFADKNGWELVCEDVWKLHDIAVKRFADVPYVLMGHSMGSFIARTVAIAHSNELDGLILSGTGHQSAPLIGAGRLACALERLRMGSRGRSKLVNSVAFGSYNKAFKPNRTTHDWLTRDEREVDKYIQDLLCGADATVGLFNDMLTGLDFIRKSKNIRKMRSDLPIYMFSGDKDPVGDMGKGVQMVYVLFKANGLADVTLRLYKDGRHEMLNGPDKKLVTKELVKWLDEKVK